MGYPDRPQIDSGDESAGTRPAGFPGRTRLWPLFAALALAEAAQIVFGVGTFILWGVGDELLRTGRIPADLRGIADAARNAMMEPAAVLVAAGLVMGAFTTIALIAAVWSPVPLSEHLRLGRPAATPRLILIALVGIMAIQSAAMALGALDWLPESSVLERAGEVIASVRGPWALIAVLTIGVAPGFGEEFLFRGYVQTRLSERFGAWPAILLTAFLFGTLHLDIVQGVFAFLMGVYLGLLVEQTDSIWPAVLCHAVNNSLAVTAQIGGFTLISRERAVLVLIGSLVIVVAAAVEISRFRASDIS
ncbi:hypothetical protein JCM19992_24410 [Thermostilla marina]